MIEKNNTKNGFAYKKSGYFFTGIIIAFLLFPVIVKNNYIIESLHPSPLSAYRGFFGHKPFSRANDYLISKNIKPINWNLN